MDSIFLRRAAVLVTAAALVVSPSVAAVAGAPAAVSAAQLKAPRAVTAQDLELVFSKISDPIVKNGGSVTLTPARAALPAYRGKIVSSTVTAKKSGKVVGKANSSTVSLEAGSYTVTTTVKVKSNWANTTDVVSSTQALTVRSAASVKTPTVKGGKVSANVSATKGAKILSQTMTVKKNGKTVKKNVSTAKLSKGNYLVTSTAKYSYSYENKTVAYAYMELIKDSACTVTKVDKLRTIQGFGFTPKGEAKDIEWTCTGNFDGTVSGSGLMYPESSYNTALGWEGTNVFAVTVDGMGSFSNPKITPTLKKGQKFTHTFLSDKALYKTSVVKGTGTVQATHSVKIK